VGSINRYKDYHYHVGSKVVAVVKFRNGGGAQLIVGEKNKPGNWAGVKKDRDEL